MKIVWILNHYAVFPTSPGGTRHYYLAKYLYENGWKAYIITASIEHNTGNSLISKNKKYEVKYYNEIPFLLLRTPKYKTNNLKRIWNIFSYTIKVLLPQYTKILPKPDVIIGSQVHPFAALAGVLLSRRYHVPFIFEVRDLWPQSLIDMGSITSHSMQAKILRLLERWLYNNAQCIVTTLPRASDYITNLGISENKIKYIPNGVDIEEFPFFPPHEGQGLFKLMYFGAHGSANDLEHLIDAMAVLKDKKFSRNIKLYLIGDGPLKEKLMQKTNDLHLNNVVFQDPIPKNEIPYIASKADAFVIMVRDLPGLYRYGISMNKIFDYMSAGRPILIAINISENPIEKACCGITVNAENPEKLADAIEQLSSMPQYKLTELGDNGRKYIEKSHNYKLLGGVFADVLDGVLMKASNQITPENT